METGFYVQVRYFGEDVPRESQQWHFVAPSVGPMVLDEAREFLASCNAQSEALRGKGGKVFSEHRMVEIATCS